MKSKNKFKEIDFKNRVCFYFDDIINVTKISFNSILINKKLHQYIPFTTFHIKVQEVHNHCVLGSLI